LPSAISIYDFGADTYILKADFFIFCIGQATQGKNQDKDQQEKLI